MNSKIAVLVAIACYIQASMAICPCMQGMLGVDLSSFAANQGDYVPRGNIAITNIASPGNAYAGLGALGGPISGAYGNPPAFGVPVNGAFGGLNPALPLGPGYRGPLTVSS